MPLSEKWVITLSTQYGCPMKCRFCSCPELPFKGNATFSDLKKQFYSAIRKFPSVNYTDRLNIHFARMGEPIFNDAVFQFSYWLYHSKHAIKKETGLSIEVIHPVLTTSLPKKVKNIEKRLNNWLYIKNYIYNGQAGLQLSINSTCEKQRSDMFGDMQIHLEDLKKITDQFEEPIGRKYCLNFAYASSFKIDAEKLVKLFNPEKFMVKITPIHNNDVCRKNGIETIGGYESYNAYRPIEEKLKEVGFDVLVFVPSIDEEDGLVTCGNAVLSSGNVKTTDTKLKIKGI